MFENRQERLVTGCETKYFVSDYDKVMKMQRGTIVKSKAGKDKDTFLVVLTLDGKTATVCDGKDRPLERPKKKNLLHLATTNSLLGEESLLTNNKIKRALRDLKHGGYNV